MKRPAGDPKPTPPRQPEPEDCCRSGCTPCVFDLYEQELERYEKRLAEWEQRQRAARDACKPS